MKRLTMIFAATLALGLCALDGHAQSQPSAEDQSVAAGLMWTGAKLESSIGVKAAAPKLAVASVAPVQAGARALSSSRSVPVPAAASQRHQGNGRRTVGILLAALAIFGMFAGACKQDPKDPCELSRVAVSRTIDAIQKTGTAVTATQAAVESASANQDNRFGGASSAVNAAAEAVTYAQNTITKAGKVAAECGPSAAEALADAQAALGRNQPTLDAAKQALQTGATSTAHQHHGPVRVDEYLDHHDGRREHVRTYTEQGRHPDTHTYDRIDEAVKQLQPAVDGAQAGPGMARTLSDAAARIPQSAPSNKSV